MNGGISVKGEPQMRREERKKNSLKVLWLGKRFKENFHAELSQGRYGGEGGLKSAQNERERVGPPLWRPFVLNFLRCPSPTLGDGSGGVRCLDGRHVAQRDPFIRP